EEQLLDERLDRQVGEPQVEAHDRAGDDHNDCARQNLGLVRPVDLLQLGPGLGDEATAPASPAAPAGLRLRRLLGWADLLLARTRALRDALLLLYFRARTLPLLAAAAALLGSTTSH